MSEKHIVSTTKAMNEKINKRIISRIKDKGIGLTGLKIPNNCIF